MVSLYDPRLEVRVGDTPQDRDRLRHAEGEVETGDRAARAARTFLGLDPGGLGVALLRSMAGSSAETRSLIRAARPLYSGKARPSW